METELKKAWVHCSNQSTFPILGALISPYSLVLMGKLGQKG